MLAESVAFTLKELVLTAVGVPVMAPAEVSMRPDGSEPEARLQV